MFLRKAVWKDLSTSIFEQLFRVLVGLGGPRIRASGGVFLGLPAALGRSWAGLGRRGGFLSDLGCHLGPIWGSKIGLRKPQERSVDRFYPPGGSRGGSRRGSGRSFWGLFGGGVGGNGKKAPKVPSVFLPLPCVFCSPRRSPAHKHNFKNCLKPLVFMVESAYAPFARAARQSFKPNESRTT